jgi:HPt (histidine-containing phosphotransfer) domain-containing protein
MDGYLTKPVNSRALAAMLERWLPQALPLRRPAQDGAADGATGAGAAPAWDGAVFDATPLREAFGSFDAGAAELLEEFVADAAGRIAAMARQAGDAGALRPLAHALKGGARSVGAVRLGDIASDLQDGCDAADMAAIRAALDRLAPGLDELRAALPQIVATQGGTT